MSYLVLDTTLYPSEWLWTSLCPFYCNILLKMVKITHCTIKAWIPERLHQNLPSSHDHVGLWQGWTEKILWNLGLVCFSSNILLNLINHIISDIISVISILPFLRIVLKEMLEKVLNFYKCIIHLLAGFSFLPLFFVLA